MTPAENASINIKARKNGAEQAADNRHVRFGIDEYGLHQRKTFAEHPERSAPEQGGEHCDQRHAKTRMGEQLPHQCDDNAVPHPTKSPRFVLGREEVAATTAEG